MYLIRYVYLMSLVICINTANVSSAITLTEDDYLGKAIYKVTHLLEQDDRYGAVIQFYTIFLNPETFSSGRYFFGPQSKLAFQTRLMERLCGDDWWQLLDHETQSAFLAATLEQNITSPQLERYVIEHLVEINTLKSMAVLWALTNKPKEYVLLEYFEPRPKWWKRIYPYRKRTTSPLTNQILAQKKIKEWLRSLDANELILALDENIPLEREFAVSMIDHYLGTDRLQPGSKERYFTFRKSIHAKSRHINCENLFK